jgi:hypothetical protein
LRTRRFRQYFAAAASETVREIAMDEMLGDEEARVKAKVLLMGQKGKTRICRATGRCVEPRPNCPRRNIAVVWLKRTLLFP